MVRQELNLTIAHSPDGGGKQSSVNGTGGAMQGGGAGGRAGSSPAAAATVAAPAPATRTPSGRTPNCARCKNHNKTVLLRGHKRYCPYVDCVCDRCTLIAKRQVVMAKQVALRRAQALDEAMGRTVIEEVDPEELKLAAESGSMPPADCVTPADVSLASLPSSLPPSPYSPSPTSSSSSSSSFPLTHPLYNATAGPPPLFATGGDNSPPLFMPLAFPLPPSPHRPYEPWPRPPGVSPYLAAAGVPPAGAAPPPLHLAAAAAVLPRPIPTTTMSAAAAAIASGPRYDAASLTGVGSDAVVTVSAANSAHCSASTVTSYSPSM